MKMSARRSKITASSPLPSPPGEEREKTHLRLAAALAGIALSTALCQAEILGPYTPDADTLHLWHMNEATAPVADAAPNGTDLTALENGATLGNESYSGV